MRFLAFFLLIFPWLTVAGAVDGVLSRQIVVLYDGAAAEARATLAHRMAELPLNHLGLVARYWDVQTGLPTADDLAGVRGVLIWFDDLQVSDPDKLFVWAEQNAALGVRFALMGNPWFIKDAQGHSARAETINKFLMYLGIRTELRFQDVTYKTKIHIKDPALVEFERPLAGPLPSFGHFDLAGTSGRCHLGVEDRSRGTARAAESCLVVTNPVGGFVERGFAVYQVMGSEISQWRIDPFRFFAVAFGVDGWPRPDPTTLSGRRIFFSQIASSGWDNASKVFKYKTTSATAAQVLLNEVVKTANDLPFAVELIEPTGQSQLAAELELAFGSMANADIAAPIFHSVKSERESKKPLSSVLPQGAQGVVESLGHWLGGQGVSAIPAVERGVAMSDPTTLLSHKIAGKPVRIRQMVVGDWPKAVDANFIVGSSVPIVLGTKRNTNFKSVSYTELPPWAMPLATGKAVYGGIVIAEPTALVSETVTLVRGEAPRRVQPYGLYYGMGAGSNIATLNRVSRALNLARNSALAPVSVSDYAAMVDGFERCKLAVVSKDHWRVSQCGKLATIRFDDASTKSVDFARAKGVVGQRHHQGSLYVMMDSELSIVDIALREARPGVLEFDQHPYLVQSQWSVSGLNVDRNGGFSFSSKGFGKGQMVWRVPAAVTMHITVKDGTERQWSADVSAKQSGELEFVIPLDGSRGLTVDVKPLTIIREGAVS